MIFTGRHFAERIEGPRAAIDQLMARIGQDPRHEHLKILQDVDGVERRFSIWSLAYRGTATFIDRLITALQPDPMSAEQWAMDLDRLDLAMLQFAIRGRGRTIGR